MRYCHEVNPAFPMSRRAANKGRQGEAFTQLGQQPQAPGDKSSGDLSLYADAITQGGMRGLGSITRVRSKIAAAPAIQSRLVAPSVADGSSRPCS